MSEAGGAMDREADGAIVRDFLIVNQRGLHARASAKFVQLADSFRATISVEKDGIRVGGTSIMGLMMLAASPGCSIRVTASGPEAAWAEYVRADVLGWTIPREYGGSERSPAEVLAGCIELARADLAPAFVLSQFQSAVVRLLAAPDAGFREWWLPRLAAGECFATVGISHLTTSRQHVATPPVTAESTPNLVAPSGP